MQIDNSLKELSKDVVCYFLDYKILSKKTVSEITEKFNSFLFLKKNVFIIHTCLRLEIYSLDGNLEQPFPELAKLHGSLAIRRLLSLMCGTQSEIIGEREIFMQVKKSIFESVKKNLIEKNKFWFLLDLIKFSEQLRTKHGLNCEENYSSIGVDIFNRLIVKNNATISVIGSGYMSDFFFKKLNLKKIIKIYWINRNVEKAKDIQKNSHFMNKYNITHIDINQCFDVLNDSDFIFAASKNSGGLFSKYHFGNAKAIVDVSYPPLFSENCNKKFYSINNTFFEDYIKNPVSKISLMSCEKEIDLLLI